MNRGNTKLEYLDSKNPWEFPTLFVEVCGKMVQTSCVLIEEGYKEWNIVHGNGLSNKLVYLNVVRDLHFG